MAARLKETYKSEVAPALMKKFSMLDAAKLVKIQK